MENEDKLLTKKDLAVFLGIKPSTIDCWRLAKPGFPQPIELSRKLLRWRRSDIINWLDQLPKKDGVPKATAKRPGNPGVSLDTRKVYRRLTGQAGA